jgi:hypothetical protein
MRESCSQLRPAAVDTASHGSDLDVENVADFLISEALDVAEHNGGTELWRQS